MKLRTALVAGALATLSSGAEETALNGHPSDHSLRAVPESHAEHAHSLAPIGVMGDHLHPDGEWMFSYQYMAMGMDGNRSGTDRVGTAEVLEEYRVSPVDMTMQMHMFGTMWGATDDLTLMVMVPYVVNEMEHVTRMGGRFTTTSDAVGDVKTMILIKFARRAGQTLHANVGLSLPTGSIDEEDDTPMGRARLPYPMQIGSGTFDLYPGLTYTGQRDQAGWGGQVLATVRLGENDNDYTLGNRILGTAWGAYDWTSWVSTSLRAAIESWGDIDGADPRLDPTLVPTADPNLRGGTRIDIGLGVSLLGRSSALEGHRLALEVAWPAYQDLDGPQLETDWMVTAGWQKTW